MELTAAGRTLVDGELIELWVLLYYMVSYLLDFTHNGTQVLLLDGADA